MAGDNPFAERFLECFDRITFVKFSKWRCQLEGTVRRFIDRVASGAICSREGQASLLSWIHLRVCAGAKKHISYHECGRTLGYIDLVLKHSPHEPGPTDLKSDTLAR